MLKFKSLNGLMTVYLFGGILSNCFKPSKTSSTLLGSQVFRSFNNLYTSYLLRVV
jgi:hypothetical protein